VKLFFSLLAGLEAKPPEFFGDFSMSEKKIDGGVNRVFFPYTLPLNADLEIASLICFYFLLGSKTLEVYVSSSLKSSERSPGVHFRLKKAFAGES